MDLHKNTSTFCVKDRDGLIVRQQKVLTDRNQITRFIRSFDDASIYEVLENSSHAYIAVHKLFTAAP